MQSGVAGSQGLDRVITRRPAATGPAKLVSSQLPINESPCRTPLAPKPQSATPGVNRNVTVSPRRSTPVLRGLGSKQEICRPSNGVKSTSMLERTALPLVVESVSRSCPCTWRKDPLLPARSGWGADAVEPEDNRPESGDRSSG